MYLALKDFYGPPSYVIRQTRRKGGHYGFCDLCELGGDPSKFIVYPGGNAFYIREDLLERLSAAGGRCDDAELERMFWPFLRPDVRRALQFFRDRELSARARRRPPPAEGGRRPHHLFDRRRLHFLKFGRMDQRRLDRLPAGMLRVLDGRCRDEIEQRLFRMERVLRPTELKAYTFVIFDLQRHFSQRFAAQNPEFLDQEKIDECLLEDICRLNRDEAFWDGMPVGSRLHPYLRRYLFMHFDHEYPGRSFSADFIRRFMDDHRDFRPPPRPVRISLEEAGKAFGEPLEALQAMSRRELVRLYRRRALQLHPDKGGDHRAFVKLTEAYQRLLATKG